MALAPRSPAKSMLGEHNLNVPAPATDGARVTVTQEQLKVSVGFQVANKAQELSPRRAARRSLVSPATVQLTVILTD